MKRIGFRQILTCGLWLLAAGCRRDEAPAGPDYIGHPLISPRITQCEPGHPGGQLTFITTGMPRTFNPMFATDPASDAVTRLIFGSLVNLDLATETPEPGLAESWTMAPDGKTWTFKLRPGVYWSDGAPLTAEDVVFTWNQFIYHPSLDPALYDVFLVNGQKFSVSKVDDLTVRVVTPEVYAPFLEFFGTVPILPAHIIGPTIPDNQLTNVYSLQTPPAKIVGCGPFRVKQSDRVIVILERNPEYWAVDKKGQRLPYFNEVVMAGVSPGMPAPMFLSGKGDIYEQGRPDEYARFQQTSTNGQFRLLDLGAGPERDFLWFNQNPGTNADGAPLVPPGRLKWFRDPKFRQAVSCGVDRERMAREIYAGRAAPVYGLVATNTGRWANPGTPQYAYDPVRARTLLAEAGLQDRNGDGVLEDADGRIMEFTIRSNSENPFRQQCARLIVAELRKIGLQANLQLEEFPALVQRVSTGSYECVLMGLGGGSEPASLFKVLKSDQPLHQWFPSQPAPATEWEARVDALMDAQMRTQDFAERKKLFDEVQTILAEQQPLIGTVAPFHFAAVRTDIANLRPSVLTRYRASWNIEELYFK